ncbi:MAG: HAMP domain-containing histidine kinase [Syntrophobacterales bacterium]|nr:HAMP domain-containing histidine kinase [Syntrophobacterales bacterium]
MRDEDGEFLQEVVRKLRAAFEASFVREMMPGVVHNFANPLNGIMGRSSLVQRRMETHIKRMSRGVEVSLESAAGMMKDIEIISGVTDRLTEMLHVLSEKHQAVNDMTEQRINLSKLLSLEARFFEFDLDFKHNIKRTLKLEEEIPDVMGCPADLSLCLSAIMRHVVRETDGQPVREVFLSTGCEGGFVTMEVAFRCEGDAGMHKYLLDGVDAIYKDVPDISLGFFLLTRKYGAQVRVVTADGWVRYLIGIPCPEA